MQALGINPRTFSPEVLLNVARIIQLPEPNAGKELLVRPLTRLGASLSKFQDLETDEQLEGEDHSYTWDMILEEKWRVINPVGSSS